MIVEKKILVQFLGINVEKKTHRSIVEKNPNPTGTYNILGQKSNGPLQTMDCKMPPVRPIFITRISHSSAATAGQY